jgi:signal transduction histidine kinase
LKPISGFGRFLGSLAGRLLLLAVVFVLLAEVMIFAPSLADHHTTLLRERVNAAQTAVLALEAAPDGSISQELTNEILRSAGVKLVALKRGDERILRLSEPLPEDAADRIVAIDLRTEADFDAVAHAFQCLIAAPGRLLRVIAAPRFESGEFIEVVIEEGPLQRTLREEALVILRFSLLLSLMVGALIYVTLIVFIVRPVRRLTDGIERFRDRPMDVSAGFIASDRVDEIGRAETALADMENQVRAVLRQKERLAGLGSAVAKIAHDLRSSLASAQLIADRLAASGEPQAEKLAPRLEKSIERATGLAEAALRYGRGDAPAVSIGALVVKTSLEEALEEGITGYDGVVGSIDVNPTLAAYADADNTHRILVNLIRNAAQAIRSVKSEGAVRLTAARLADAVAITVSDDGPGVPDRVRAALFEPFATGRPQGGTGLGLAIARELARAQGGDLVLETTPPGAGASFTLTLPSRAQRE